jgi:hypothetical protein
MMKDKDRIKEKMYSGNSKASAKRARSAAHPELEQRVFRFVDAMRKRKLSVPGSLIQSRALKEAEKMEIVNFKASQGWLENFKLRFGLKNSSTTSQSNAPEPVTYQPYDPTGTALLEDMKDDELVDLPSPLSLSDVYDRIMDIERFANTHNLVELTSCTRQMWQILARKTQERRAQAILQAAMSSVQHSHATTPEDDSGNPDRDGSAGTEIKDEGHLMSAHQMLAQGALGVPNNHTMQQPGSHVALMANMRLQSQG